ncbi:uncharacterized protein [Argopecten irradians]|uniref:uncharacterized protein n=1 Tax=Argopecten irradians TaxID=31199 RepID=UPI003720B9E1
MDSTKTKTSRGKQCCVFGCMNFFYQANGCKDTHHFFKIPKSVLESKQQKDRWCALIKRQDGRDGFSLHQNTVICQDHFRPEDINVSLVSKRWTLEKGVEPSVFSWKTVAASRKKPTDRSFSVPLRERTFDVENQTRESNETKTRVFPSFKEVGTQTDPDNIGPRHFEENNEHTYSFKHTCDSSVLNTNIDHLKSTIDSLTRQINMLHVNLETVSNTVTDLKEQLAYFESNRFGLHKIKDDPNAMQFYTGFQNYGVFQSVFEYLEPKAKNLQYWRGTGETSEPKLYQTHGGKPGRKRKLSLQDEFFMVLIRLKVGLFVHDIADRFEISQGQFSKIFTTWISFLNKELPLLFPFPSQKKIRDTMPEAFALYPTTRDCTEVFVEIPSSMLAQSQTWSNYKNHNTYKVLVGVAPTGNVTFVSDLWGGRVSDKEITKKCGLLEMLEAGDNVMADRGFEITDILPSGTTLNIPPFKGSSGQLTSEEVEKTMNIASVRIHVERAIGRIKNYHILDGVLPLSLSHIASPIFRVVAHLTCFLQPLVPPGPGQSSRD